MGRIGYNSIMRLTYKQSIKSPLNSIAIIAMVEDPSNFTKVANETTTTRTTPVVKLDQLQDYTFSLNDTARATGEVAQRFLSSNLTNGHEESLATIFPLKNKNSLKTPLISKEKFDWSIVSSRIHHKKTPKP